MGERGAVVGLAGGQIEQEGSRKSGGGFVVRVLDGGSVTRGGGGRAGIGQSRGWGSCGVRSSPPTLVQHLGATPHFTKFTKDLVLAKLVKQGCYTKSLESPTGCYTGCYT